MARRTARGLHTALSALGAILYFLFVIPRWWVLTGDITPALGTIGRIATGLPIAAAAVPVMLTLRQSLNPELKTPELALRLRAWSAVLHVVAGALLIVTAVVEIWLSLEAAGPWLFAVYGAAGSIAILAVAAFILSFVAERPPGPPKPPKVKKEKAPKREKRGIRQRNAKSDDSDSEQEATSDTGGDADEDAGGDARAEAADESVDSSTDVAVTDAQVTDADVTEIVVPDESEQAEPASSGALLNRRPTDKKRRRLRR